MRFLPWMAWSLAVLLTAAAVLVDRKLHRMQKQINSANEPAQYSKYDLTRRLAPRVADAEKGHPKRAPKPWQGATENERREHFRTAPRAPEYMAQEDVRAGRGRYRVRLQFAALYAQLDLDPEQIDRFENAVARTSGANLNSELVGSGEEMAEQQYGSTVRRLESLVAEHLGEDAVEPFRQHAATFHVREVIDDLYFHTFHSAAPLTPAQSDQLIALTTKHFNASEPIYRVHPDKVDWDAVITDATEFLSKSQLDALRAINDVRQFDVVFKKTTGLPLRRPLRGL